MFKSSPRKPPTPPPTPTEHRLYRSPAIRPPTREWLESAADEFGLGADASDMDEYGALIAGFLSPYTELDDLEPDPLPSHDRYPRCVGHRPDSDRNPLNAWYWQTTVPGANSGPLKGKTVALKDNVALAGVPMMNGSRSLESYTPEFDATIATRILDAGGTIAGKAACDDLCMSGAGFTSSRGPILNPHDRTRSTGGSSGGSAALVASGAVDMATGGDQGGSIRIPASWCGVVGLKPTWGLVPYTGIMPIDVTLDHVGPICATVEDCAALLTAIAGPDGLDPRQNPSDQVTRAEAMLGAAASPGPGEVDYAADLGGGAPGLRVGVLKEGFGSPGAEAEVEAAVREVVRRLSAAGATVTEVSVPWHLHAGNIWCAVGFQGIYDTMVSGGGVGTNYKGYYPESMAEAFSRGIKTRARDLSHTCKLLMLMGKYLRENYHGKYHAKAQNLRRTLTRHFNEALSDVDVLVMPTTPIRASRIPDADCSVEQYWTHCIEMIANTSAFDVTGHPACSVPVPKVCVAAVAGGKEQPDLPIGFQIVGKMWDEKTVLRVAKAVEDLE